MVVSALYAIHELSTKEKNELATASRPDQFLGIYVVGGNEVEFISCTVEEVADENPTSEMKCGFPFTSSVPLLVQGQRSRFQ